MKDTSISADKVSIQSTFSLVYFQCYCVPFSTMNEMKRTHFFIKIEPFAFLGPWDNGLC